MIENLKFFEIFEFWNFVAFEIMLVDDSNIRSEQIRNAKNSENKLNYHFLISRESKSHSAIKLSWFGSQAPMYIV